jgi:hypothetical protein
MPRRWVPSSNSATDAGIRLNSPKSRNAMRPVVEEHAVARVRVARELVVAVHAAEVEAEDDLGDPVAVVLGQLLHLLEARARTRTR